jgi:hypothetical protein
MTSDLSGVPNGLIQTSQTLLNDDTTINIQVVVIMAKTSRAVLY